MNKSQRIFINTDNKDTDKYIKVKLEQSVKTLEFLSMSIDTTDIYQNFNSDYGVLVGRVIANNNIGIPNAKLSIFIPISDSDYNDPDIYSIYPYSTPRDKNNEGKRYNLLPRVGKYSEGTARPPQPFGSLPIKEELITNEEFLKVYKKYYKYTATTNDAGDYMIFGVPIGSQIVHMSIDITDIGKYSMSPASMIKSLGYSENLFIDQRIIKPSSNLDDLPHIETQEIGVDIIPFWGDKTTFEIGITRQDFKIRSVIKNTFTIFASVFTDDNEAMWGDDHYTNHVTIDELYRAKSPAEKTLSISTKRIGKITEKIYYYKNNISDDIINSTNPNVGDPATGMTQLYSSEYSIFRRDGDIAIIINCNRDKVITDELGNDIHVADDYPGGVFTKFKGFLTLEVTPEDKSMDFTGTLGYNGLFGKLSKVVPYRYILKFPQYATRNQSFVMPDPNNSNEDYDQTKIWRKKHFTFNAGKFYTLSKFHGTVYNSSHMINNYDNNGFLDQDEINIPYMKDPFWNTGIIVSGKITDEYTNENYDFPSNSITNTNIPVFGANWLNFSIYLPQQGFLTDEYSHNDLYSNMKYVRTASIFSPQVPTEFIDLLKVRNAYYNEDNKQVIAANVENTKWFARADLNWTDIIEVPIIDIQAIKNYSKKGFKTTDPHIPTLTGTTYRNGINTPPNWPTACPINGGKENGNGDPYISIPQDTATYIYKGIGDSNCIQFLYDLGLLT